MGFDIRYYEGTVDDAFLCGICLDVLEKPVNTPCGHTFCRKCVMEAIQTKQICPMDRIRLREEDLSNALSLKSLLEKLIVKCRFWEDGCSFLGQRSNLSHHESSCHHNPDLMILCEKGCNLTLLSSELKEHKCCEALIKKLHDKTMALIASETQNTILETKILQLRDRAEDLRSGLRDEQIEHQKLHSKIIDLETNNQSLRSSLEQEKEKNEKLCAKAAKLEKDVRVLNSNAVENQALVCQLIQNNKRKIAKDMEDLERSVKKTSCVTTIRSNSVDSDSDSSDSTEIYEELSDVEQKEKSKILVAGHVKLPRRL